MAIVDGMVGCRAEGEKTAIGLFPMILCAAAAAARGTWTAAAAAHCSPARHPRWTDWPGREGGKEIVANFVAVTIASRPIHPFPVSFRFPLSVYRKRAHLAAAFLFCLWAIFNLSHLKEGVIYL